jgi:ligand-binding SRPBCC domain-containing protein
MREGTPGTLIRDVIDYEIGLGIIGSMANALFVRRQIAGVFAERQSKLPDLLR